MVNPRTSDNKKYSKKSHKSDKKSSFSSKRDSKGNKYYESEIKFIKPEYEPCNNNCYITSHRCEDECTFYPHPVTSKVKLDMSSYPYIPCTVDEPCGKCKSCLRKKIPTDYFELVTNKSKKKSNWFD